MKDIVINHDPFIMRMAHHSIAMPEFKKEMSELMKTGKAFINIVSKDGTSVNVHPSEQLLDAFYRGMGLK